MYRSNFTLYIIGIIVVVFLGNCKEQIEADLHVFPEIIRFHENDTVNALLFLEPAVKGKWHVSSQPDWLIIEPSSGSFNGDTVVLKIFADVSNTDYIYQMAGHVEILSNTDGKAYLGVEVTLDMTVNIELAPKILHFDENEWEKNIKLINAGRSNAHWRIETETPWVSFKPEKGLLSRGKSIDISVEVSREGLPVGQEIGKAFLKYNAENGHQEIGLSMDVPPKAVLEIARDTLQIGYFQDQISFFLYNTGNVPAYVNIQSQANYLAFSPTTLELQHGDSVNVTIQIDRSTLETNVYDLNILIGNSIGEDITVPVKVFNYIEKKQMINGTVKDAVYDKANDVLIIATQEPNVLKKISPESGTIQSLVLNSPPRNLSIDASGSFAVISHANSFSYINLSTMQLVQVYTVSTPVGPIIIAPNQWVYAIPNATNERIRCIYLPTGMETLHSGSNSASGITAQMHPSGNSLYRIKHPTTLDRLDITSGTAEFMWNSPTFGGYGFGLNIWISETGDRIFASNRRIYRSSDDPEIDMTYNGILQGEGSVIDLTYHSGINKTYAIFQQTIWPAPTVQNVIRKYDNAFMALEETFELPDHLVPDGEGHGYFMKTKGYYIFLNSAGTKLFVVLETPLEFSSWAVLTMNVNENR